MRVERLTQTRFVTVVGFVGISGDWARGRPHNEHSFAIGSACKTVEDILNQTWLIQNSTRRASDESHEFDWNCELFGNRSPSELTTKYRGWEDSCHQRGDRSAKSFVEDDSRFLEHQCVEISLESALGGASSNPCVESSERPKRMAANEKVGIMLHPIEQRGYG